MRIRPGKTRSLIAGILMLVVMVVGLFLMPGRGILGVPSPMGGAISAFRIVWIAFGLIGAGAAFYNAFSRKGVALYEIDMEDDEEGDRRADGPFCPKCGKPVGKNDKFCRNCGTAL
ncbi:MAG: zinc-ribbon domain-containing protein [Anaerolineae bacterium]|nr:zinc-ribbon domain-containing protein [Anaerolineae bacterium]